MGIGGWSRTLRGWFGVLWERGQSSTLGVVILLGIVVITATLFGAILFADFGGDDEQLLANVQGNVTLQGITLDHEGGDTFDPQDVEVLLQGDTQQTLTIADDFETDDGTNQFAPGDTWTHTTNNSFYGGEFRLLVIHEPTNSVLLDQPHSLQITDISVLVENWQGEMRGDRAEVFGDGSEYNFTVQVNAEDGEPPETVPMGTARLAESENTVTLANNNTELGVNISLSNDDHGMVTIKNADGETGTLKSSWNDSADSLISNPYDDIVLEAELDESQSNSSDPILDGTDTTTVRVLRNKSVFSVAFASGYPSVTNEGKITAGYNVENVGATPGSVNATVTYTNDTTGTVLYDCTVETAEIDPGNSVFRADEGCTFDNTGGVYGDINVTVSVPGDNDTEIRTLDPPELTVDITDAPSRVPEGGDISVDANITNVGGVVADQTVELDGDGYSTGTATETVSLAPGESTNVTGLTISAPSSSPVTVPANVSTKQNYDTSDVDVRSVLIPIQSYDDWDLLSGEFERAAPTTQVYYNATTGADSTGLSPGDGSGKFEFQTISNEWGAAVWEDLLGGENWLRFEYNSTELTPGEAEVNVSVGGVTRFSTAENTGNNWEHRLVDIADAGDNTRVGFGVDTESGSSCLGSNCTLYYDNVTFVNHSLPLQTESDWKQTAGTFDGPSATAFAVDTTTATNRSASGQFTGTGTGTVEVREQLSDREYLTFDYRVSGSLDSLEVLANGSVEGTITGATSNWNQESVFLDGYAGNTKLAFRVNCPSGCTFNLDNVTLAPPPASIPITTEQDWVNASSSFETGDDAGTMGFEVNDTNPSVDGASGRFTAGEFSEGVARVSVTEDLSSQDAFSFDYKGEDLGIAQVFARVTVAGTTEWTSNGDPGGWTTEQIDVSNYTGMAEITFEMGVTTETLNEEEVFFDNVTWTDLPSGCNMDYDSYDRSKSKIKKNYTLTSGDFSRCALKAKSSGPPGTDFLTSSNGFDNPQWFDPPEDNIYPDRGGQISYYVKADSGTPAMVYFGDDNPSTQWYEIRWNPGNEALTVSSSTGNSDTSVGGDDGTDQYYRIIVDWDLNDAMADAIYARAVDPSGNTVAHAHIQDNTFDGGPLKEGHIGVGAGDGGTVIWDGLEYGETDFEETLPAPGDSYYANGPAVSGNPPDGLAHSDGWIHDRLPVEEGETRTYSYYVDYDSAMNVSLRDGPSTETQAFSDIENEIHTFSDGFDYGGAFRAGREVMVSLTIDYTDPTEVQMRAKAVTSDGYTKTLTQTWSGASSYDEVYVSTYEWDGGGPPPSDSLRLLTKRTGQYAAAGFPLDDWVHNPPVRGNRAGFDHLGGWVDRNDPIRPGGIVTIPYFASTQSASVTDLTVQLRDEPGSDQQRGPTQGPSQDVKETLTDFMQVNNDGTTILVVDYTVPGEVFLRAFSLDTGSIVGETVVSLPPSAPDDVPIYLSTYEENGNGGLGSIRYSPF